MLSSLLSLFFADRIGRGYSGQPRLNSFGNTATNGQRCFSVRATLGVVPTPTSRADRARFQWVMTFYLLALPAANKRYRTFLRHRFACSLFLLESNEHECLKTALLCNVIDIILSEALTFIMRCLGTVIIVKKNAGMFFKYCETRIIHYSWGAGIASNSNQAVHPFPAELPYLNFHLREVVSRYRDPQLHVSENYSELFNLETNICNCWCSA